MEKDPENFEQPLAELDLGEVVNVMDTFDERYGYVSSIGSAFDVDSPGRSKTKSDPELESAGRIVELLELKQGVLPILERTGLDLVSLSEGNASKVILVVRDGERFVDYLRTLDADRMTESQIHGAETALACILDGLQSALDKGTDDNVGKIRKSAVAFFPDIVRECDRLGESIEYFAGIEPRFAKYAEASDLGYLAVYRKAETLGLTEPFTGKGFELRWHTDANPEYLKEKWNEVVDVVQKLAEDPNATYQYQQVLTTAQTALEAAIIDVEKALREDESSREARHIERDRQFLDILKKTEATLSEYSVD